MSPTTKPEIIKTGMVPCAHLWVSATDEEADIDRLERRGTPLLWLRETLLSVA